MKGKGWKLDPYWVMHYAQKEHLEAMRKVQTEAFARHEELLRAHFEASVLLCDAQEQSEMSTHH